MKGVASAKGQRPGRALREVEILRTFLCENPGEAAPVEDRRSFLLWVSPGVGRGAKRAGGCVSGILGDRMSRRHLLEDE